MMSASYLGKWDPWYSGDDSQKPYGDVMTYRLGADHLRGLAVEDWGCGYGWFRTVHEGPYIGIDGTKTQWSDVIADLRDYQSETPGLWMRGVMEHNYDWMDVLCNACASTERIALVTFTPDGHGQQIGFTEALGVPDIAVPWDAVDEALREAGFQFQRSVYSTSSAYGLETVWLGTKG
jgi:hypothetical protein